MIWPWAQQSQEKQKQWPITVTIDGKQTMIDYTASHPIGSLGELIAKKEQKGWRLLCMNINEKYSTPSVSVFWSKTVETTG